jgi:hypothetical protein
MKKTIIMLIAFTVLAFNASAQTIEAKGKKVKLTDCQRRYLFQLGNKRIVSALVAGSDIKNNDMADLIIAELSSCKFIEYQVTKKCF